jgi:carboxymethylenebutenolidase
MLRRSALIVSALAAACAVQRVDVSTPPEAADEHADHMGSAPVHGPMVSEASAQQGTPGLPPSNNTAAARLAASPRHGEWVKVAWESGSADSLMAWIVYPAARAKAPVVVVVHENIGLTTWVRSVADQLAADGFIAIAPDLLSRVRGGPSSTELSRDSVQRIIGGVMLPERSRGIAAVASFAMMQPSAEQRYGVIGFCWGGQTTFAHSASGNVKGFSGGVAFYGPFPFTSGGQRATGATPAVPATIIADSIAKINAPVMLLNGANDARIGAMMPALDSAMKANKKDYVGVNYEGAIHGFMRAQDDAAATGAPSPAGAANLAAAKDAWPRTIAFLKKNLGVR